MVNPLFIFVLSLVIAFFLAIFDQIDRKFSLIAFYGTLFFNLFVMTGWFYKLVLHGDAYINLDTAGFAAPLSINLQLGLLESGILTLTNLAGLLVGIFLYHKFKTIKIYALMLYLVLIMGINGLVMTRDLFNIFVFLEIVSISTYALISLDKHRKSFSAGFKYMMAGGITSTFFLLGIIFVYYFTGHLNIDTIIRTTPPLIFKTGIFAAFLLLISIFIELKPFPANGWALDVYEAVNSGFVSIIAVVNSAAILFVFYKLIPIFPAEYLQFFTAAGILTFLFSNFLGLKQTKAKRLLGYSSIAQMGLVVAAISYTTRINLSPSLSIVIAGGIFVNHFFTKASLFMLTGIVKKKRIKDWHLLRNNIPLLILFGISLFALAGLPPFPGFLAKWEMAKVFVTNKFFIGLAAILLGSLFEAYYLLRWFGLSIRKTKTASNLIKIRYSRIIPISLLLLFFFVISILIISHIYDLQFINYLPLIVVLLLNLINSINPKIKAILSMLIIAMYGYLIYPLQTDLQTFFAIIFIAGGFIILIPTINRKGVQQGFYGFLLMLIIAMANLIVAKSYFAFFLNWEFMTIAAYLLISRGKHSRKAALTFITFSLAGAYLMLAGFGFASAISTEIAIVNFITLTHLPLTAIILLTLGFLIKVAALGFHIWIPGAYAEAEDDVTPFFSSLFSKTGVLGIILTGFLFLNHYGDYNIFYWIGWLGTFSALIGAFLATFQEDAKKLLAYSGMSQIGYIVASIGLLNHLGWVSALYLTFNHFMFKAMIFIAIAGVIHRTQTRKMYEMGGLIKKMPFSFISVLIGIIAVSGVPPLSGFGSKWLLYNAFLTKGWYLQAGILFFASAVSFLYLYRLIHTIFLGQLKYEHQNIKEAPLVYLVPQFIFMMGIMAISMFPNLIIKPLSAIAGQYFDTSLMIDNYNIFSELGYWNGNLIMMITMGVFAVPLIFLIIFNGKMQKVKQFNIVYAAERPESPQTTHVAHNMYAHYKKALGKLTLPRIKQFWNNVHEASHSLSDKIRHLYTGNGQTYILHILIYIVVFYLLMGV